MRLRNRRKYLPRPGCKTAACDRNSTVCVKYLHKTTKNLTRRIICASSPVFWKIFPLFRHATHNILWLVFSSPFFKKCQTRAWDSSSTCVKSQVKPLKRIGTRFFPKIFMRKTPVFEQQALSGPTIPCFEPMKATKHFTTLHNSWRAELTHPQPAREASFTYRHLPPLSAPCHPAALDSRRFPASALAYLIGAQVECLDT